jgi:hypothetical protein
MLGVAHHALTPAQPEPHPAGAVSAATVEVEEFIAARGWKVTPGAPAIGTLARVLMSLRSLGWQVDADVLAPYADAVDPLASWELTHTPTSGSRARAVESVVVGTVVFETALCALRRLAQEHHSALRNAAGD